MESPIVERGEAGQFTRSCRACKTCAGYACAQQENTDEEKLVRYDDLCPCGVSAHRNKTCDTKNGRLFNNADENVDSQKAEPTSKMK